jgi:hypothetical protein
MTTHFSIFHLGENVRLVTPASMLAELRAFSRRQWQTAAVISGAAFFLMGIVGETLPGASLGRTVPVEWWNYVTSSSLQCSSA